MASVLFCNRVLNYLEQSNELDLLKRKEIAKGIIGMIGNFMYDISVPSSWYLHDMERLDHRVLIFHWISKTEHAFCPECGTNCHNKAKTYKTRHIQDLPISGMTVYHAIKGSRYYCDNPACDSKTFVEQFEEITDKDARLSNRLKDFVIREAIESSCNGTSKVLKSIGIKVSTDTINREVKKKGALVVDQNLKRDDVKVLSVDDINLRKGNSSTACSVFIDAQTHRVLVIVQGATGAIAEKVIQQYPSAVMVSRDRGTAYASAATKCGKIQVADRFHLVQNMHQAIKETLFQEITHDLFVREGDGWISIVDRAYENPASNSTEDQGHGLVVIQPLTLETGDIERRIHFAGLKKAQAIKYKKTLAILELTESGLRTRDIMKKLSMKKSDVLRFRAIAPETINNVELKIDEYFEMHERGQWEIHQKTIAKKARPTSKSIVEPYKETVLRMFDEGKNHRNIHPVITEEGFTGSSNAIYQYLIKYAHENNIAYGYHSRVIPLEDRNDQSVESRPPRISIQRTSRHTIYECLLHTVAKRKKELKQTLSGLEAEPSNRKIENHPSIIMDEVNKTNYTDQISGIIFDTKSKDKKIKKN